MDSDFGTAWQLVVAAAAEATRLSELTRSAGFALGQGGDLRTVPTDDPNALLIWQRAGGWEALNPSRRSSPAADRSLPADLQRDVGAPVDGRSSRPEP
jgi:hypothetical protein